MNYKPVILYSHKSHTKLIGRYDIKLSLHDYIHKSQEHNLASVHYTQINNLNATIIVDNIFNARKLFDKGNEIYYYIGKDYVHNHINKKLYPLLDGLIIDQDLTPNKYDIKDFEGDVQYV